MTLKILSSKRLAQAIEHTVSQTQGYAKLFSA